MPNIPNVSGTLGLVSNLTGWTQSTNAQIERLMDDAAYSSAHPDDTLVVVGPPRLSADVNSDALAAVGMVQNISINQQKPFQPMMAIGSSRSFFVAGKAQGSAQIQRLFMNTDNLMRRLYQNAIDVKKIDPTSGANLAQNPAGSNTQANYLVNLDSEFFLVPFGMGIVFKNKARQGIGALYMEMCVIPNFSVAVQSGQAMIMEGCSLFFDRVVPFDAATTDNNNLIDKFKTIFAPSPEQKTTFA